MLQSSFTCIGTRDADKICKLSNVYIWNGLLFYVYNGSHVAHVPKVDMNWHALEHRTEGLNLNYVNFAQFGAVLDRMPEIEEIKSSILWHRSNVKNWWHTVWDGTTIIHKLMCQMLDLCTFESSANQDFRLVFLDDKVSFVSPAADEAFRCLSANKPLCLADTPNQTGKVWLVRTGIVGMGPSCSAFGWCKNSGNSAAGDKARIEGSYMATWRARMLSCAGISLEERAGQECREPTGDVRQPLVMIVQRAPEVSPGRSFLNLHLVVPQLRERLPRFQVHVAELHDASFKRQVQLWSSASIVVAVHGAALLGVAFLPRDAVLVEVLPAAVARFHEWFRTTVIEDYAPITNLSMIEMNVASEKCHVRVSTIRKDSRYNALEEVHKTALLTDNTCPPHSRFCEVDWLIKASDYHLDLDEITATLKNETDRLLALFDPRSGIAPCPARPPLEPTR